MLLGCIYIYVKLLQKLIKGHCISCAKMLQRNELHNVLCVLLNSSDICFVTLYHMQVNQKPLFVLSLLEATFPKAASIDHHMSSCLFLEVCRLMGQCCMSHTWTIPSSSDLMLNLYVPSMFVQASTSSLRTTLVGKLTFHKIGLVSFSWTLSYYVF